MTEAAHDPSAGRLAVAEAQQALSPVAGVGPPPAFGHPPPEGAFSKSMVISGIRCMIAYVLIPYVFPLVGFGSGAGPWIGLPVGLAAIAANVVSIRRFHRAGHRWKWPVSAINAGVIVLLAILVVVDAADLLG